MCFGCSRSSSPMHSTDFTQFSSTSKYYCPLSDPNRNDNFRKWILNWLPCIYVLFVALQHTKVYGCDIEKMRNWAKYLSRADVDGPHLHICIRQIVIFAFHIVLECVGVRCLAICLHVYVPSEMTEIETNEWEINPFSWRASRLRFRSRYSRGLK